MSLQTSIKYVRKFVYWGGFWGFHPYSWDYKRNRMTFRSHWFWKLTAGFWSVATTSYAFFLMYNCYVVLYVEKDVSAVLVARTLYMCAAYLILDGGFLINTGTWGEHQFVFNEMIKYVTTFQSQIGCELPLKLLAWNLRITYFAYFLACTNAVSVFFEPGSPRLFTSLLNESVRTNILVKLVCFWMHMSINWCQFYFLSYNSLIALCYVYLITPTMKALRLGQTSLQQQGLSPDFIYKQTTKLLVLQGAYTSAFGTYTLQIYVWGICIITLNIFQAVVFQSLRPFLISSTLGFLLGKITTRAGKLFEASVDVKASFAVIANPSWFPSFVESYRPARVPMGGFFFFDRGLALTLIDIVVNNAVGLIVSYQEDLNSGS